MESVAVFVGFVAALATLPAIAWWLWCKFSKFGRLINRLPGPKPLPLVGSALQVVGGCDVLLAKLHEQWPIQYGELYRVFIGSKVYVVASAPELIEPVANSSKYIDKGNDYGVLQQWLGNGLLASSGTKWKSRRRLLTPAFHFHIMEDFFETFNEHSSVLCRKIDILCAADGRAEINVGQLTGLCTLDIICETAMGCKVNAQMEQSEYVKAVNRMNIIMTRRMLEPWTSYDAVFNLTPIGREFRHCLKVLHNFTDQVIKKRRQEFHAAKDDFHADDKRKRRPFLDLLLEASMDGAALDDRDIREEVDTFMFEGHDTTATAINWFLHCMASNPQCQDRAWRELHSVFGDSDRPCTRQDLAQLKYLECCIKEALRLYPSVPAFVRLTTEPIRIGDYTVPAGCDFLIGAYAMHHNPRIYPDPNVFDPDRFAPEQSAGRHPYAYLPFSAGPRNCIGQRFAMAEEKVVLSSLLRRFRFQLSSSAPKPRPAIELTLKSTVGIHLVVSRR
nr:CYP4AP5 protein [Diaphanosoma celebensis]